MQAINHRFDGIFDVKRMVCWPGNEAPWALYHTRGHYLVVYLRGNYKSGVHGYPKTKYMWLNLKISDQNWTKQMQEYLNHIARKMLPTFWGVSARKKTSVYILKRCREISQRFGERLREGKLVNNLEIFRIRHSLMVSEAIFHLGLLDLHNSTHHTQPRSIIASYLNLTTFI